LVLILVATVVNFLFFALEQKLGERGHDAADVRM
jgi:hypothetical protein